MVFILASILLVIHNIIVNSNKLLHERLLVRCILYASHACTPSCQQIRPIEMHVLHSRGSGFSLNHVKELSKIWKVIYGTSVYNKEKHSNLIVSLSHDVLMLPNLAQNIDGLNTEPFAHTMGRPNSPSNIDNTHDFTYVLDIMSRLKRLDLTWVFTSSRNIWASVHPVHPGLPVHRPVRPCFCFGDADNGGSSTAGIWADEVETAAYLRGGRGNDYICWSLRHNF
uniref:AC6 n=1 Tax=Tomato leaf curl Joydebpur virus TaxID=309390 RepID=A0A346NGA0_9GEMI|nr:AC6 [Tomato leaf curl Joydebpur virus]